MSSETVELKWSAQLEVAATSRSLLGDKILLPPSALEQLLAAASMVTVEYESSAPSTSTFDPFNPYSFAAERQARAQGRDIHQQQQQQLPHPLTFRLVNPSSGRVVHAGIREFSADEGQLVLSPFLLQALGMHHDVHGPDSKIPDDVDPASHAHSRITVHAKQLPKGTYVRLRPLEAGYDSDDWKSLLEQYLRTNFTTLTTGEVLTVPGGKGLGTKDDEFQFLIDKFEPSGDGICVVDTDLEVDIEPLNEEQAKETLQRRLAKTQRAGGTTDSSSIGGKLEVGQLQHGQVQEGEYVDYEISKWDRSQGLDIEVERVGDDEQEVDLFVSPLSSRQRARPRDSEHVFGEFSSRYPKRMRLQMTSVELEGAEMIYVAVHSYTRPPSNDIGQRGKMITRFSIQASTPTVSDVNGNVAAGVEEPPGLDDDKCRNCQQWVPKQTMLLHENFCLRNNVLCPQCHTVFKKTSLGWSNHWHCPHDSAYGSTVLGRLKHDDVIHTSRSCPNCPYQASNLVELAHHRTTTCPAKRIICRFCHLLVPQEDNATPESIISGLTPHEYADGARTTECHLCDKIVRLRDMATHLRHHDLERRTRSRPLICRNVNCGRTLQGTSTPIPIPGLCRICFGPLYVPTYDPEGKALRRRVERRYITQLVSGCGTHWCQNTYCKTGRARLSDAANNLLDTNTPMGAKRAIELAQPWVSPEKVTDSHSPLHFCVDETSQARRSKARDLMTTMVATAVDDASGGGGEYALEWCVLALETEAGDFERAQTWLKNWAPTRREEGRA